MSAALNARWMPWVGGAVLGALAVWAVPPFLIWTMAPYQAHAQDSAGRAERRTDVEKQGREVTLTGRIVDAHCFATGQYPTEDRAQCTAECLRAGIPGVLETSRGAYLLGHGMKGVTEMVLPQAYKQVRVKGNAYEKAGLRYLDIVSMEAVTPDDTEVGEP